MSRKSNRRSPRAKRPPVKRDRNGLTRCRVCGCTASDACSGGCSWVDDDLCSVCDAAALALSAWLHDARRPNKAALWREAVAQLEREYR